MSGSREYDPCTAAAAVLAGPLLRSTECSKTSRTPVSHAAWGERHELLSFNSETIIIFVLFCLPWLARQRWQSYCLSETVFLRSPPFPSLPLSCSSSLFKLAMHMHLLALANFHHRSAACFPLTHAWSLCIIMLATATIYELNLNIHCIPAYITEMSVSNNTSNILRSKISTLKRRWSWEKWRWSETITWFQKVQQQRGRLNSS